MIVGSLYLIFKEKVYLDAATGKQLYVQVPFVGKLTTNAPILAVIFLGIAAVVYPVHLGHTTYIQVKGRVESNNYPVAVYATSSQATSGNDENLIIPIPELPSKDYQPHIVFKIGSAFHEESIDMSTAKNGVIKLEPVKLIDTTSAPTVQVINQAIPDGFK